jgi:hypothetical protein
LGRFLRRGRDRFGSFRFFRNLPGFPGLFPFAKQGKIRRKTVKDAGAFQGFPYPIPA